MRSTDRLMVRRLMIRRLTILALAGALAGCGARGVAPPATPAAPPADTGVRDLPVKLGDPYVVDGVTYTPRDVAAFDEVGYAGFYGSEHGGKPTANGERFDPAGISAAHRTLPLPTYAEVTALDTGRTILVRINDRGPFAGDRLIDLSEGAARQLGIAERGVAAVRVRKTSPIESERAVLRGGGQVAMRIETPPSLLRVLREKLASQPRPATSPASASAAVSAMPKGDPVKVENADGSARPAPRPVPKQTGSTPPTRIPPPPGTRGDDRFIIERSGGAGAVGSSPPAAPAPTAAGSPPGASGWLVQLASFGSRANAESLAKSVGGSVVASTDGRLFRVRMGPYASERAARGELESMRRRGYPGAVLVRP